MRGISLRALSVLFLIIAFSIAGVSIYFSSKLLGQNILEFLAVDTLPPELASQLFRIVVVQAVITVVTYVIISTIIFFILERWVIRPLHTLSASMQSFSKDLSQADIPALQHAPYEIENIVSSLEGLAKRVEEAQLRSREVVRSKTDFISTAAHQLRTPLTGIRWTLEALAKDPSLDAAKKTMVQDALTKNHQLIDIVKTLLDVSAVESGKYHYDFKPLELPPLILEVIAALKEAAYRQGVSVSFIPPEYAPDVFADKARIRGVLTNLIENAIRYTPRGGSVTVSLQPVKTHVIVTVSDTGIGVPDSEKNNIFERFYRASNAATMQNAGNGLGLYIARNVIRDHGGELQFKANENGVGTSFFFSLPVVADTGEES